MDIKPYPKNAKQHPKSQVKALARAIAAFGFSPAIEVDIDGVIVSGHGRFLAAQELGYSETREAPRAKKGEEFIPYIVLKDLTSTELKQKRLADNKLAETDVDMLLAVEELEEIQLEGGDITLTGYTDADMYDALNPNRPTLSERFLVPPFSVLNARAGEWQDRKREWLALGIKSELGRDDDLAYGAADGDDIVSKKIMEAGGGTSVFDPVLAELAYKWFAPPKGAILDPFCGGSVRGIVAAKLGYEYAGTELRKEQVEANIAQGKELLTQGEPMPTWVCDDAKNIAAHFKPEYDLLFTCPPYADLEVYSEDPRDISNMPYEEFIEAYQAILKESASLLKDNRFAVVVVGEVRGGDGAYYNFVPDTINAMEAAGLRYYNDIVLVTAIGSLSVRAGRAFEATRKIGKTHQNVLVFYKGDPKKANMAVKGWPIEIGAVSEDTL